MNEINYNKRFSFSTSVEIDNKLEKLCKSEGKSKQEMINLILLFYLEHKENILLDLVDFRKLNKKLYFLVDNRVLKGIKKEAVINNISHSILISMIINSYINSIEEEILI